MDTPLDLRTLSIGSLARLCERDWRPRVHFTARPYLNAMFTLERIDEDYGADEGSAIVAYFLSNASTWRGPVARAIKRELRRRLDAPRTSRSSPHA